MALSLASVIGKHVAVVGGGKTGAAVVRVLLRDTSRARRVTLCDDAPLDKVRAGLQKNGVDVDAVDVAVAVDVNAGGIDAGVIDAADLVVLSPGVPRAHPALQRAVATPGKVINELEVGIALLGDAAGVRVLAITGTNGKSTTTTMAGAIAQTRDPQAFVGGNLGTPLCAAVCDGLTAGTPSAPRLLVLELSSYQLESLTHLAVHAAVVTNLTPDHLDRYDSVDAYYAAKARLFDLVVDGGGIGLNRADPETARFLVPRLPSAAGLRTTCHFDISGAERGVEVRPEALVLRGGDVDGAQIPLTNPRIVGHHNRQNAAAAAALALMVGLRPDEIARGLDAYGGIAHRLERVGEHQGVVWWNDSKATNVDAAVTALKSFASGVHLIAGGRGKGSPYQPLVDAARGKVKAVYTIGEDAPAVAAAFAGVIDVVDCATLDVACARAAAAAAGGDHVVLSPACASFDQFRDYGHRGERFRELFAAAAARTP